MMVLRIDGHWTGTAAELAREVGLRGSGITRLFREMLKDINRNLLLEWHRRFRPRHFQPEYASMYSYARRSVSYEAAKERALGHKDPLVWTGESRLTTRTATVTATSRSAKLSMSAANLAYHVSGGPNMRAELTDVVTTEELELGQFAEDELVRVIDSVGGTYKRKLT